MDVPSILVFRVTIICFYETLTDIWILFHKLFYIHNFHCCISLPTKEKNMPSFWKIIGSWFGASSESGSHTAPLANPPNPPAPPSPLIPTHRKKWYEQQRHNPRHNLPKAKSKQPFVAPPPPPPTNQETSPPPPHQSCPSSLPSVSVVMNQEKNQKMPPPPPPPHQSSPSSLPSASGVVTNQEKK